MSPARAAASTTTSIASCGVLPFSAALRPFEKSGLVTGASESSACSENGSRIVLKPIRRIWPIMSPRSRDQSPCGTCALVSKPNQLTPWSTTV